jgi:hypothetical protein
MVLRKWRQLRLSFILREGGEVEAVVELLSESCSAIAH